MSKKLLNHLVNTRIDKQASVLVTGPGASVDSGVIDAADFASIVKAETQIGVSLCKTADQTILADAADGEVLRVQVDSYERVDPTDVSVAADNLKRSHISTASIYKTGGKFFVNTASTACFEPDALRIQITNNLSGLSELRYGAVH